MTGQRGGPYALVRRSPGGRGIVEIVWDEATPRAAVLLPAGRI